MNQSVNIESKLLNAVIDTYLGGHTAHDKHLKNACWMRDNAFLQALLNGYLESDGHYDEQNRRWRLRFTQNDQLAQDLRTICARLGATISLRRHVHKANDLSFPGWQGEIRFERSGHHNERDMGEIVAIRRSRARHFWHIGVADEPHTFALASGVLTCNSKPNPIPESVQDRPTKAHEYLFMLTKSSKYYYDSVAIQEPLLYPDGPWGGRTPRSGVDVRGGNQATTKAIPTTSGGKNKRSVWSIVVKPFDLKRCQHCRVIYNSNEFKRLSKNASGQRICACGSLDWMSHFAAFSPDLVVPCVKAGSSEYGVCAECGAPWERSIAKKTSFMGGSGRAGRTPEEVNGTGKWAGQQYGKNIKLGPVVNTTTLGWRPTCTCDADVQPAVVLDPFVGSGTTCVVAKELLRFGIGIDQSADYLDLAVYRLNRAQQKQRSAEVQTPFTIPMFPELES